MPDEWMPGLVGVMGSTKHVRQLHGLETLDEIEWAHIQRVLSHEYVKGNKTLAAAVLGVDRRTLYRKVERFEALEATGWPFNTISDE